MRTIEKVWYGQWKLAWLLWPLSLLFGLLSGLRRLLYRLGIKQQHKAGAFVIVVGNISVGGNGKTPVVLAITEHFRKQGVRVGVLSRGYGGSITQHPHVVRIHDAAEQVGDEPSLIARRTGVPVVIDPVRSRGADKLANELGCEVIVCDDGLQHYALHRDLELVVMDQRLVGNGRLLPMGPLRESPARLQRTDALILNGDVDLDNLSRRYPLPECFSFTLQGTRFRNIIQPDTTRCAGDFLLHPVTALAGIGHPQRYFDQLREMGLTVKNAISLPDHFQFSAADIPSGPVLMTEKDAVKVFSFAHNDCWYLPVDAVLPASFYALLDSRFNSSSQG